MQNGLNPFLPICLTIPYRVDEKKETSTETGYYKTSPTFPMIFQNAQAGHRP
jgi:hypothetical protein